MKSLKLAHNDGHTDVCYDSSGSFILTCGSDGKVCIWEGKDDTDTSSVNLGDKIFAIAFQGGRFFAATEENTIRIHTFPDGVSDGMVTRFTAPCRHFVVSDDGSMLVAGADDFKIKVISMEENECICLYSEHQAPILSVSIDPTKEFIASSSCDGTVKVWHVIDGTTEKTLNLLSKCSDPGQAKSLCRMCWSTDGEHPTMLVLTTLYLYMFQHPTILVLPYNVAISVHVLASSHTCTYHTI
uniref:WDHD1 first WD40 domain-containing protein n=1 Tax=Biomphalaria glabrata TaxID=6526 RepID=A0A2C9M552_BIOGL